ncbi:hypothetical protein RhiirC2_791301 [Rhizophagus irregularis]|uniref:Uncharacterized protein n=1 Tax=Rhizophagus irregularis TaxID=588596 RepID=A0A2N1MJG2_9GLOM|nr:hypothetical protein RhiirC2_791301 [Rhizophagus irregularis]
MSNKPEEKLVPVKWSKESDEELKRLIEESKATVNWTEVAKWEAKGRPYEIDEEILLFYKDELTNLGSNGKSTNLYSTSLAVNIFVSPCKIPTPTPTVIPCCQPGNPGFKTSGEIHAFSSLDTIETIENTTPEKCYEESFNKPDCIELLILINVL